MMQRSLNPRRLVAFALVAAATAAPAIAAPLRAQQPTRTSSAANSQYRVIVQDLANKTDAKSTRFGAKTSDLIRKGLSQMSTHTAIADKDVVLELKKLGVTMASPDCTTMRQLGARIGAEVVMCGDYSADGSGQKVSASFYTKDDAISYDILPFTAATEAEAANKIVGEFQNYVKQLQLATICQSDVASEQWQEALDQCTKALEMNPRSTTSLYFRATALLKLNKPEEALAGYQKVLEISPINQEAMRSAGTVAAQLGKSDLSSKYYHDYLELNPGDESVRLVMANDLNKAGDPVGAAKLLEDAIKSDTTNFPMMGAVGNYYMVAGANDAKGTDEQKAKAKTEFANALKYYEIIQRNVVNAKLDKVSQDNLYRYMMQAYQGLGQSDRVLAIGTIAAVNDSVTAPTLTVYASELAKGGKLSQAVDILNQAKVKDPTMKIAYNLASMSVAASDLDNAVKYAAQAKTEGATDEQLDQLAVSLAAEGQKKSGSEQSAYFAAAKQIAQGDKPAAMVSFYQGSALYQQAAAMIPKSPKVISKDGARAALSLLQRARPLIAGASAFTEAASTRAQLLSGIDQTLTYLNQVLKQAQ